MPNRLIQLLFSLLLVCGFASGVGAQNVPPAEKLWTAAQIEQAGSPDYVFRRSLMRLYGSSNTLIVDWAGIAKSASLPALRVLMAPAVDRETTTPLELKFPAELAPRIQVKYDAYLRNVIYVVHKGWQDRFFDLHFFEDLFITPTSPLRFKNRLIDDHRITWLRPPNYDPRRSRDEHRFYMMQGEPIDFEMAGRVWVEGQTLKFEATVINHSANDWIRNETDDAGALMCFRTRNNVDFRDVQGERVFYHDKQGTVTSQTVLQVDGLQRKYFNQWTDRPDSKFSNALTKFNQDHTLYCTFRSDPPRSVGGNREDGISCIHANLAFQIPRGQSQTVHAEVIFGENPAKLP